MVYSGAGDRQPTVALLISSELQQDIFSAEVRAQLYALAHIISFSNGKPSAKDLQPLLQQSVACITGWDTPPLDDTLLDGAPQLRLIAHTAGSIRALVPPSVFERGVYVSHSNASLAEGVAEFTILQALLCLRRVCTFDRLLKEGQLWVHEPGRLLRTQTFGIVSMGSIGREVISRLKPFGCRIIAYDPYMDATELRALGAEPTNLKTLFASADIVSLHTPLLPATRGMIDAEHLALLRDGAIFLNTARAGLVDEAALLRELATGRFMAALDVFHIEPLPIDSILRTLPNVILSPHIAALTSDTLYLQGQMMVDELRRFLHGEKLQYEVRSEQFSTMA